MDRTCTGNFVEETFSDAKNGTVFWIFFHMIKTPKWNPAGWSVLGDYTSQFFFAIRISPYEGPVVNVTWNVTAKGFVARCSDDKKNTTNFKPFQSQLHETPKTPLPWLVFFPVYSSHHWLADSPRLGSIWKTRGFMRLANSYYEGFFPTWPEFCEVHKKLKRTGLLKYISRDEIVPISLIEKMKARRFSRRKSFIQAKQYNSGWNLCW